LFFWGRLPGPFTGREASSLRCRVMSPRKETPQMMEEGRTNKEIARDSGYRSRKVKSQIKHMVHQAEGRKAGAPYRRAFKWLGLAGTRTDEEKRATDMPAQSTKIMNAVAMSMRCLSCSRHMSSLGKGCMSRKSNADARVFMECISGRSRQ